MFNGTHSVLCLAKITSLLMQINGAVPIISLNLICATLVDYVTKRIEKTALLFNNENQF
jgi:hypothetical protein